MIIQHKNAAAENFIREIFKDPKVVRNDLGGGAFEYRLPSEKALDIMRMAHLILC
ncbi:hypothetical protein PrNR1418_13040 [Providencia rettgeri]|nr:hypothetical protein PrNR1418_13040 [Providencia rettgeri]